MLLPYSYFLQSVYKYMYIYFADNSTSTHYVKVSYRNSTGNIEPIVLDIPTCGKLCPVEKFAEVYDNLLTVNWDWECSRWVNIVYFISSK